MASESSRPLPLLRHATGTFKVSIASLVHDFMTTLSSSIMELDDNTTDEVEAPQRSFVYESHCKDGTPKDVTHLSVQVQRIERYTFYMLSVLVEVQLNDGLQLIGDGAFAKCVMLQHIVIPSTVEVIKGNAFGRCTSLVNVHLCEGLKTLGQQAFGNCTKLSQISVPSTVETLCEGTFRACKALEDVELKEGLRKIGPNAFCECFSLTTISVPSTVKNIDNKAFGYCNALSNVEIPRSLKSLSSDVFRSCRSLRRLPLQRGGNGSTDPNLPLSVRTIGSGAFHSCAGLTQLSLSSTVDKIDEYAFSGCSSLTDVELPEGLRIIEQYAFSSCISLCGITIPSTTLKIGQYAFIRCTDLVGVEFSPKCKAKFGQGCFRHCDALANICLPPSVKISSSGVSMFTSCRALTEFHGCEDDLVEFVQERYETMPPVHRLCYFASQTSVEDLDNAISIAQHDSRRDALEMTPFHMVATGPKLRPDLLQVLLDHYPLDHLGWMDKRKKVMMEYLVSNPSPNAIPLITMILKKTILGGMTNWGLEGWRTNMAHTLETIDWGTPNNVRGSDNIGHSDIWRQTRNEILTSLAKHAKVEVASILELALWKMNLRLVETTTIPEQEPANRAGCRTNCGSEVVISNVLEFYSDCSISPLSAHSAHGAMSMLDHNVHWMEYVSPDQTRH